MSPSPDGAEPRLPAELDPRREQRSATRRPRGPLARVLRVTSISLLAAASVLVLAVSASGYSLLVWSDSSIDRVDAFAGLPRREPPSRGAPTTFLMVGSDGRSGMSAGDQKRLHVGSTATAAGRRADTMLLVHVSGRSDAVTVVSLPRDSYVTIPAHRGTDGSAVPERRNKLNAAYAVGGPQLAVATVERSTGVRVDHYVEVDFLGFERLVDAVGGVDVCAPRALRDRKAGLRLPAGVSHVDGQTGLAYVRARSLDGRADLGRIERQQRFLAAMVHRVTSREVLLDPRAMVRFLDAALGSVRADPGLQREQLVELATRLRHLSGADVRFLTVPIADPSARPGRVGAVALWDDVAARELFASLRDDAVVRPAGGTTARSSGATVPPGQVRVQVYNGAGVAGLGSRASRDLIARGFAVAGPARNWAAGRVSGTVLRYDERYTESIKTLSAALPGARLEKVTGLGRTLQVVVAASYDGARAVTLSPAGAVPAGAAATGPARATTTGPRTAAEDGCS
jgi:LCP family protein required for cell wall assembly